MNTHLIEVKYIGQTNFRPSRVQCRSHRFNDTIVQSYSHEIGNVHEQGVKMLERLGYTAIGDGETREGFFVLVSQFVGLKQAQEDRQSIAEWNRKSEGTRKYQAMELRRAADAIWLEGKIST